LLEYLFRVVEKTNDHADGFFNKIFVTLTYTISLLYLLFLAAIGRKNDTNIIHGKFLFDFNWILFLFVWYLGTGSTVRSVPTTPTNSGTGKNK